jgi:hypothetical protein
MGSKRLSSLVILALVSLAADLPVSQAESQSVMNEWIDKPQVALDTNTALGALRLIRTMTAEGLDLRTYSKKKTISSCIPSNEMLSASQWKTFQECSAKIRGCDIRFVIKNGKVANALEHGSCWKKSRIKPEPGWERLLN